MMQALSAQLTRHPSLSQAGSRWRPRAREPAVEPPAGGGARRLRFLYAPGEAVAPPDCHTRPHVELGDLSERVRHTRSRSRDGGA